MVGNVLVIFLIDNSGPMVILKWKQNILKREHVSLVLASAVLFYRKKFVSVKCTSTDIKVQELVTSKS